MALLDRNQLDRGDAERVGAMRGTGCEDPAALRWAAGREHLGAPVFIPVKPPDQPDAVEPSQVLERLLVFVPGEHLQQVSLGLMLIGLVPGIELQRLLLCADEADGLEREFVGGKGWAFRPFLEG